MIKIIAIDLDGTLFNAKKEITTKNKEAIKKAKDLGIRVVLASGRPFSGIIDSLKELDLISENNYVICFNGARVYNTLTMESIVSSSMSYDDIIRVYEEAKRQGSFFHVFTEKQELLTAKNNPYTDIESTINKIESKEVNIYDIPTYTNFIKAMIVDSKENIDKVIPNVNYELIKDFQMVRSSNIFLEFLNKMTNKGFALEALGNKLGITKDEIMAIGDAPNDSSMIKFAKYGIAMKNAFDEVKNIAYYITENDNENSGVAEAIEKFCF